MIGESLWATCLRSCWIRETLWEFCEVVSINVYIVTRASHGHCRTPPNENGSTQILFESGLMIVTIASFTLSSLQRGYTQMDGIALGHPVRVVKWSK